MKPRFNNFFFLLLFLFLSSFQIIFQILNFFENQNYISNLVENYNSYLKIINFSANAPYLYRLLMSNLLKIFIGSNPEISNFIIGSLIFRLLQNLLILIISFNYYQLIINRKLLSFLGTFLLILGIHIALGDSIYFYLDSYTNVILFLMAGLIIKLKKFWILIPLTFLASFNREEAVFISILLIIECFVIKSSQNQKKYMIFISILSFLISVFVYTWLRTILDSSAYNQSFYGNIYPGIQLIKTNLRNKNTYLGIVKVFNINLLTLFIKNYHSSQFIYQLILIVLPWFVSQLTFGSTNETRLFLPLLSVIFIPELLFISDQILNKYNFHSLCTKIYS